MRKLFCVFFAALLLLSCFAFTASAAEAAVPAVEKDLGDLKINGEPFSAEKHLPKLDEGKVSVISAAEVGYCGTISPSYAFYIYLYNPSKVKFIDNPHNGLEYQLDAYRASSGYIGIKIDSVSRDKTFLRLKVTASETYGRMDMFWTSHDATAWRYYDLINLRLQSTDSAGQSVLKSYFVDKTFSFKGHDWDNSLECESEQLGTLEVELHDTNWISPNAALKTDGSAATIYDHYEINSVYFRVPKSYFEGYDYLKSAHMIYDALKLTPIILTRENDKDFKDDKGQATKNAILKGTVIEEGGDLDVYDLTWVAAPKGLSYLPVDDLIRVYTESARVKDKLSEFYDWTGLFPLGNKEILDYESLAYYFASLPADFEYESGKSIAEACVTSEELREYFMERYNDPSYSNYKLYSECNENIELWLNSTNSDKKAIWEMDGVGSLIEKMSFWDRMFVTAGLEDGSYLYEQFGTGAKHLEVIDNPSYYASIYNEDSIRELCNTKLFIGVNDYDGENGFRAVCQKAAKNDEYVVILRFAFSDYRCVPVYDVWEYFSSSHQGPVVALAVEKWGYRNINMMDLVFSKDNTDYTVSVASNTVDSLGDLSGYGDGSKNGVFDGDDDWWKELLEMLKKVFGIMVGLLLVVVLWPILSPVFKLILDALKWLISKVFGWLSKPFSKRPNKNKRE